MAYDHYHEHLENPDKIPELAASVSAFLRKYGTRALMGMEWGELFSRAEPERRFDLLIDSCGYPGDTVGFFSDIAGQIRAAEGKPALISFRGKPLPRLLVYHILESAMPGQGLCRVRTPEKLSDKTGAAPQDKALLREVMETYPVRLSDHVIRQSLVSGAVAVQYLPFEDELDPTGHELTFDGHFKQGLMEQMYRNRAIFLLDMRCPVYCRFCFRKHKSLRKEPSPEVGDVEAAVSRVRENADIREILITGGEPLLNMRNLETAVEGLLGIRHVETLRIATRSLAYYPHLFLHHGGRVITYLKSAHARCREQGKQLEIGLHMLHSDELSIQTLEIINDLTASGIPVYVQTPFLKGVNHRGPELGKLFNQLRQAGAQIYYIFTPCHPIHGTRKYWSPISLSLEAYQWMREHISDRCMPKLCTATPLGKMEWHTSGWAVEPCVSDPDHIWIRTPYTRSYFDPVTKGDPLPVETRENSGGTLDVKCQIHMGRPSLFLGETGPAGTFKKAWGTDPDDPGKSPEAHIIQPEFYGKNPPMEAPAPTDLEGLRRPHRTRLMLTLDRDRDLAGPGVEYAAEHGEITDLVVRVPLAFSEELDHELEAVEEVVRAFGGLDRYLCIRLQWARVQTGPEAFGPNHISRLRALAKFDIASPLRIEFETWWLRAEQMTVAHRTLFRALTDGGMAVYANTALIAGLNTDPEKAEALVHEVRQAGMEFHHVYTEGLEIQKKWNRGKRISPDRVVALASRIRMNCTGREVPLYVRWTHEGDRDFGGMDE